MPFFIEWETTDHPSKENKAVAEISKIEISGSRETVTEWLGTETSNILEGIEIIWVNPKEFEDESGIVAIHFSTPQGNLRLD